MGSFSHLHCREEGRLNVGSNTRTGRATQRPRWEPTVKISVLVQTGRELMAIVDRRGDAGIDPLIRRHWMKSPGEWL
jgi:hypothetical protein